MLIYGSFQVYLNAFQFILFHLHAKRIIYFLFMTIKVHSYRRYSTFLYFIIEICQSKTSIHRIHIVLYYCTLIETNDYQSFIICPPRKLCQITNVNKQATYLNCTHWIKYSNLFE